MTEQACAEAAAAALGGRGTLQGFSPHERAQFVRWAARNRLAGLLWQVTGQAGAGHDDWFDAACRQTAYAAYQDLELRRVVGELARTHIQPIFLKGTALAHTIYPDAALRPRADHDILVRAGEAAAVRTVFERLGYEIELQIPGGHVASQVSARRTDDRAMRYVFDIHLKISNALAYADRLPYDEIRADAVSMPRLDAHALAPSPGHSFLIACVHRVAHHFDADDLLWLYDIHLLARSLTEAEWARVVALAEAKQLCQVVVRGIERAGRVIGPSAPDQIVQRLRECASREPQAPLVDSGTRTLDVVLADLAALPDWRARLRLLAEHVMPPVWYMRRAYPQCPAPLLPLAYVYRIVRGARKWSRRR